MATVATLVVVVLLGIAAYLASRYLVVNTKDSVVNQRTYLGNHRNSADIYDRPSHGQFCSPLNVTVDPMDRLMLVDIMDDPEYKSIELQIFDDARGRGARVILYHQADIPADFYYTSEAFAGKVRPGGTSALRDMEYHFDITASGLDAALKMKDHRGKSVEFRIKEASRQEASKGFLAPIGGGTAITFDAFPFFHLKGARFVPRAGTEIAVRIDGRDRTPAQVPIPVNWKSAYLCRYTTEPILGLWNRPCDGPLAPRRPGQQLSYQEGRTRYELVDNAGHREIREMIGFSDKHSVSFEFSPPIPDLLGLKDGIELDGRFSAGADEVQGIVAGDYHVKRHGDAVEMEIRPLEGWQPMPGTSWVRTWIWRSTMTRGADDAVSMRAAWIRQK